MLKYCDEEDNHGNYNQQFFIIHGELKLEKKKLVDAIVKRTMTKT
jgi:hypothetical protein